MFISFFYSNLTLVQFFFLFFFTKKNQLKMVSKTSRKPNVAQAAFLKQTHVESETMELNAFSQAGQFSADGQYFALISPSLSSYRLRVWECASNQLIVDYIGKDKEHLNSFAWNYFSELSEALLALCLESGQIQLFHIAQKRIYKTLGDTLKKSMKQFIFSKNNRSVGYALSEDKLMEWELNSGEMTR